MKRIRCKSKNENAVRIHWLSLIADLMEKLNLPCSMYLRNTPDRLRSLIVEEGQRDGEILENLSTVQRKCRISSIIPFDGRQTEDIFSTTFM